ncbi:unnamed protein product, partial [Rotaria sp. Silwood1]
SISITLLHVGLPILTEKDEKKIVNNILDHSKQEELTLDEALSFVCQLVIEIIKENFHYDMSCIQIEWFYDFLLNHPDIILKYSHWFNKDIERKTLSPSTDKSSKRSSVKRQKTKST